MSDFLNRVTEVSSIRPALLVYGGAGLAGLLAGRLLARNARRCMIVLPVLLSAAYLLLFAAGAYAVAAAAIILALGILAGMAGNTGQYMISDAAPEAPDFANGLFLTSANLWHDRRHGSLRAVHRRVRHAQLAAGRTALPPQASDRSSPGTEPEN